MAATTGAAVTERLSLRALVSCAKRKPQRMANPRATIQGRGERVRGDEPLAGGSLT
jgi:hypothetical protein